MLLGHGVVVDLQRGPNEVLVLNPGTDEFVHLFDQTTALLRHAAEVRPSAVKSCTQAGALTSDCSPRLLWPRDLA